MAGAMLVVMSLSLSSCASMFGNRNCRCTHPGPCECCTLDQSRAVVVAHQPMKQTQTSSVDKKHLQELLNMDYSIKKYVPEAPKPKVWVDEPITETREALLPTMKQDGKRLMPRDVTMDNTENAIYLYYNQGADGKPEPLRLRVQYYADDPLKFQKLLFVIDGFEYFFTPTNFQRGKGRGVMIWENSDDVVKTSDKDLLYALTHCTWCQLRLIGADGIHHVKMLTKEQLNDFNNTLHLYLLSGGTFAD